MALKNNHKALYEELVLWLNKEFDKKRLQTLQTIEKAHGRIETRTYALSTNVAWLEQKEAWVGLRSVIMVENEYQDKHNITTYQRRYCLSSLMDLQAISEYIRNHWSIENSQHWVLDVVFSEDSQKSLERNEKSNKALLTRTALNLIRQNGNPSLSIKRNKIRASQNTEFREQVLFGV